MRGTATTRRQSSPQSRRVKISPHTVRTGRVTTRPLPASAPSGTPATTAETNDEDKDEPAKPSEGAEVVRLDRFRKK